MTKYYDYVTEVSETVKNTITGPGEESNTWIIILGVTLGLIVIGTGFIIYYCYRKK